VVRTQIYLTAREKRALEALAAKTGKSQSELIREAIDAMIDRPALDDRRAFLASGRGMWAGRRDLPDFGALRGEFDRSLTQT
jgi:hypothetical protein